MRWTYPVILALSLTCPAHAAQKVSVAAFELALAHCKPDDNDCAAQISNLELTQRLSNARMERLSAHLPGPMSRQRLVAAVGVSSFLDPPTDEIPTTPAPSIDQQRTMLGKVVTYVNKTLPQLPNFYATLEVTHFQDSPHTLAVYDHPLHQTGTESYTVLYRNGLEEIDTGKEVKNAASRSEGLNTWGTFGPVLGIVLLDAARNKLVWSHWEQRGAQRLAVFSFDVPKAGSHYQVDYCCTPVPDANVPTMKPFLQYAAYHGEMAVDLETSAILRFTLIADLKPTDPIVRASIVVEYGAVEIGGKFYICPVHSISLSHAEKVQFSQYGIAIVDANRPLQYRLNDVRFDNYHVFRSDSRILADADTGAPVPTGAPSVPKAAPAQSASASAPEPTTAPLPAQQQAGTAAGPAPPPQQQPEVSEESADSSPVLQNHDETSTFTLQAESRLVDVAVIVTDKKGRPVRSLSQVDFEIADNGQKQQIRYFAQPPSSTASEAAAPQAAPAESPDTFTNAHAARVTPSQATPVILLFDSSSVSFFDLNNAREEVKRFLKYVPPQQPVGLYVMGGSEFHVVREPTTDRAAVLTELAKWMPNAGDLARSQQMEMRNRQQFDYVHSGGDLANVNGNGNTIYPSADTSGGFNLMNGSSAQEPTDPKLLTLGDDPVGHAIPVLEWIGRHLAPFPGQKSLVWIASDNVLADWTGSIATREESGQAYANTMVMHAQETLNDAHVSIYPLDVSQLEAGVIAADIQTRNVEVFGHGARDQSLGELGTGNKPGREKARMQQDLHPIQGAFRDLAAATGGRALGRASDIAAELNDIASDSNAIYMLSFSPAGPADGKIHTIDVHVPARSGLRLRYRSSYLFSKPAVTLHDRFRDAIWKPSDNREIVLQCTVQGSTLQVSIAAADLGLTEANGRWTGTLDIFLVQRDNANIRASLFGRTLNLRLLPATYAAAAAGGIHIEQPLPTKMGEGDIRLLVVDRATQRIGTLTIPTAELKKAR